MEKLHSFQLIRNLNWLWSASAIVYRGSGVIALWRRLRFLVKALRIYGSTRLLIDAHPNSPLGKLIKARPQTVGAVVWPYQCSGWNAQTRLARICDHYTAIERLSTNLDFPIDSNILLVELNEIRENLTIVLDQPIWFMREGQLSLNLFLGDTRLYTLAFSLFNRTNDVSAFVGAIQGRDIEGILELYRDLTKAAYGMRPRDLVIEIFRIFCNEIGVDEIFAVSNEYRHHHDHDFFGDFASRQRSSNYNEIWIDRGATLVHPMYFKLTSTIMERDLLSVPSNKRSMYRKRYALLKRVRENMRDALKPTSFVQLIRQNAAVDATVK
jgi:uncharacterized protein VirK/YbjX